MKTSVIALIVAATVSTVVQELSAENQNVNICTLPLDTGMCRAGMTHWGFDAAKQECVSFTYGGCGGNENNFRTKEECTKACPGRGSGTSADDDDTEEVTGVCSCKCPRCHGERKLRAHSFIEGKRAFPRLDQFGNEIEGIIFN